MNTVWKNIMGIIGPALPSVLAFATTAAAAANPIAGIAVAGISAAIKQHLLGNAQASDTEVQAAVTANPQAAIDKLKPLDDHLASVAVSVGTGASTVPQGALPTVTETVTEAVIFATNDAEDMLSPPDKDGGAVLSTYLTAKQIASRRKVYCAAQGKG